MIFIQCMASKVLEIEVDYNATIEKLKQLIEAKNKIPIGRQLLTFGGRVLENSRQVSSYDIQKECCIMLQIKRDQVSEPPAAVV